MTSFQINIFTAAILLIITIPVHAFAARLIVFVSYRRQQFKHPLFHIRDLWLSVYVLILFAASLLESLDGQSVVPGPEHRMSFMMPCTFLS